MNKVTLQLVAGMQKMPSLQSYKYSPLQGRYLSRQHCNLVNRLKANCNKNKIKIKSISQVRQVSIDDDFSTVYKKPQGNIFVSKTTIDGPAFESEKMQRFKTQSDIRQDYYALLQLHRIHQLKQLNSNKKQKTNQKQAVGIQLQNIIKLKANYSANIVKTEPTQIGGRIFSKSIKYKKQVAEKQLKNKINQQLKYKLEQTINHEKGEKNGQKISGSGDSSQKLGKQSEIFITYKEMQSAISKRGHRLIRRSDGIRNSSEQHQTGNSNLLKSTFKKDMQFSIPITDIGIKIRHSQNKSMKL